MKHRGEKKTMNEIITAVSSLGFPIVMCGVLFWYQVKCNEEHKEEVDRLRTALENNTLALQMLCDKLKTEEKIK